jgi:soluble lytic murein transglycosylase-like protein
MKARNWLYLIGGAAVIGLLVIPKKQREAQDELVNLFWDWESGTWRSEDEVLNILEARPEMLPSVLSSAEGRVLSYLTIIESASSYYNISSAMIAAIIHQESRGKYAALGRDGEIGLMQILPDTAHMMGFRGDPEELYNPSINIFTGVKYLRFQLDRYGNLLDMIAAYNAGSVRKKRDGAYINLAYVANVAGVLYPRYVELTRRAKGIYGPQF